jgi:hypothetical protein
VIRFTWMQSRMPMLAVAAGLAAVAVVLGVTGPHLAHLYGTTVAACQANCPAARSAFSGYDQALQLGLGALIVVVPGIIGLFWGAPLVAQELETGTWRLAWTQSVTRTRWLAARLGVLGLASVLASGLLSLMVTWWSSPLDQAAMTRYASFDQRDVVPLGYAALAFMLAATAGALIRRTLPAMASALAAFVAVRVVVEHWVRPDLIAPAHLDAALNDAAGDWGYGSSTGLFGSSGPSTLVPPSPNVPNAWLYPTQIVDRAGHALTPQVLASACPRLGAGSQPGGAGVGGGVTRIHAATGQALQYFQDCVTKIGSTYHEVVTYQPASHYWPLQWYELAICLAATALLGWVTLWWVRRRLT